MSARGLPLLTSSSRTRVRHWPAISCTPESLFWPLSRVADRPPTSTALRPPPYAPYPPLRTGERGVEVAPPRCGPRERVELADHASSIASTAVAALPDHHRAFLFGRRVTSLDHTSPFASQRFCFSSRHFTPAVVFPRIKPPA